METASTQIVDTTPKSEYCDVEQAILNNLTEVNSQHYESSSSPEPSLGSTGTPSVSPEPTQEKKPVKKRKSWGQELPTPTTNLPPRKRAKTEAEKEQRRIERVLRNRAAAQSSRERKRKEVEALEDVKNSLAYQNDRYKQENSQLTELVKSVQEQNRLLQQEVQLLREQLLGNGITPKAEVTKTLNSPSIDLLLTPNSITHDSFSAVSPSEISSPLPMDGTLDPSHLSTPSNSLDIDPFSLTQHTAVSADWSLYGNADVVPPLGELDPMFSSFGEFNGTDSQTVDSADGEQSTNVGFGSSHTFPFDSLVDFHDDEPYPSV